MYYENRGLSCMWDIKVNIMWHSSHWTVIETAVISGNPGTKTRSIMVPAGSYVLISFFPLLPTSLLLCVLVICFYICMSSVFMFLRDWPVYPWQFTWHSCCSCLHELHIHRGFFCSSFCQNVVIASWSTHLRLCPSVAFLFVMLYAILTVLIICVTTA